MNKHTTVDKENLRYVAWLVARDDGSLNLTRGQPSAGLGEIAVSISITVPRSLFKRPALRAVITLPETPPMDPTAAVAVLTDAIERGCDFSVSVSVETEAE